jgi:transcription-repair coupling factor (superfamily II helicase)
MLSVKNKLGLKRLQLECNDRFGPTPKAMQAFLTAIEGQLTI